ncbi:MAG TPA: methyltransferase domain-containing protein [Mycobacteriales bacterium]|nr:methyltransferase domain-containing protein [Mycobacteriales bacterium]
MAGYALELTEGEVERYRFMAAQARATEAEAWRAAGIVPGARVADVGCGPGATLLEMADVVGPTGSVTGVDADPAAVATANELIARQGLATASAVVGQAEDTGLAPASVDVAVVRHVLAHNGGREQAIVTHLAELVRPGGCVYLVDVELTAGRLRGAPPDAADLMARYAEFHAHRGNDPRIGLRLAELLAAAGLEVLEHRGTYTVLAAPVGMRPPAWHARHAMVAEGFATTADVARWQAALEEADRQADRPVMFLPLFTAIGRRSS